MKINSFRPGNVDISEIISDDVLLKNEQDVISLLSEGLSDHIILYEHNVEKDFFDLSTRIAGNILQKFTNYHIHLAIVGNFDTYPSKTLKDFIYESNNTKDHLFVGSRDDAIQLWMKQ